MNVNDKNQERLALDRFLSAADELRRCGLAQSEAEASASIASVARRFIGGQAAMRLVLDYLPSGDARIALIVAGQSVENGEPMTIQLFVYELKGVFDDGSVQ